MSDSLGALLALVEKHGGVVMPSRSVEKLASVDARIALGAAKVLAPAPAAATWPCDVRGCSRDIRANRAGARKALVAVCSQAPAACAHVELGFDDVAQQEIAVDALVAAVCALFDMQADRAALGELRERRALGEAREPLLVAAALRSGDRDLFWAGTPRDMDLAAFGARRERIKRKTRVLVPTSRNVPLDVASRHAAGEHVEIVALDDLLVLREGKLALADAGEDAPNAAPVKAKPRVRLGLAAEIGAKMWEDIAITEIDGTTVRIACTDGASVGSIAMRTFVELGFADSRKKGDLVPIIAWSVLLLMIRNGRLRPSHYAQFGKSYAVKKGIEVTRKLLKAAFGLERDPFLPYRRATGWAPRFRVTRSCRA